MNAILDKSLRVELVNRFEFFHELRSAPGSGGLPLSHARVTQDLAELIEEVYDSGILSEKLSAEADELHVEVSPIWSDPPFVAKVGLVLTQRQNGKTLNHAQEFAAGRWSRSAQLSALQLCEEGTLSPDQLAYSVLLASKSSGGTPLALPPLQPLPIVDQSLADFGVRNLSEGSLVPDRPVLINTHLATDAVRRCESADVLETGGPVLGKIIRLDEPLAGTQTRIVTILSAGLEDDRHVGTMTRFTFSPEGLAEAAQVCQLRGLGESVMTVFHTHGWNGRCGNCNQSSQCTLAESTPSLQDYQLLESLFASKATLLPIAGRKLGDAGRRPVLQVHAWRGGTLRPIRWQQYDD